MSTAVVGVTIGVGALHARLAEEAAGRMRRLAGIDVRVLGADDLRGCGLSDPNHLKFRLFDLMDAENILYFDADAFCLRPWDVRALAGGPEWVAVRGFWFDERVRHLGEVYGFGAETFNSGLFLCNRRHHAAVLRLAETLQTSDALFHGLHSCDEVALSTATAVLGVPIRWLDRRCNWLQYGLGELAEGAGVVVAHACRADLRQRYLEAALAAGAEEEIGFAPLAGKTFIYDRVGHDRRPLFFRTDGTIGEGGGDAERFFFVRCGAAGPELVIGSVLDETCRLSPGTDGTWRGRWSKHERMAVTLTQHRAQVLLDLLRERGPSNRALVGAEVGVWEGESSRLLLEGLPGLHLYLVDAWRAGLMVEGNLASEQGGFDAAMTKTAAATAFAARRRTVLPCEQTAAVAFVPDDLDLVFLDADHSYEATRLAIEAWWPKVMPGGLLAGHDYANPNFPGVKRAVDEFAAQRGLAVRTGADMTWWYEVRP